MQSLALTARREGRVFRLAWYVLLSVLMLSTVGETLESKVLPILDNIRTTDVKFVLPNRICWHWAVDKVRNARAIRNSAHLYVDDREFPLNVGLLSPDRRGYDGTEPVGHHESDVCVAVPMNDFATVRYGVSVDFIYRAHMLWDTPQTMPWIDLYVK